MLYLGRVPSAAKKLKLKKSTLLQKRAHGVMSLG